MAGPSIRTYRIWRFSVSAFSTFAGNPYFIDLDMLVEEGLLFKEECEQLQWGGDPRFVDYERIYFSKNEILRKAYGRF